MDDRIAELLKHHSDLIINGASKEDLNKNMKLIEYYKKLKNKSATISTSEHEILNAAKNCTIDTDELEHSIRTPTNNTLKKKNISNQEHNKNDSFSYPSLQTIPPQNVIIPPVQVLQKQVNNTIVPVKDDETISIASSSVNDDADLMELDMIAASTVNDEADDDEDEVSKRYHEMEAELTNVSNDSDVKQELDILQKQINSENGTNKFKIPTNFLLESKFKHEIQSVCTHNSHFVGAKRAQVLYATQT